MSPRALVAHFEQVAGAEIGDGGDLAEHRAVAQPGFEPDQVGVVEIVVVVGRRQLVAIDIELDAVELFGRGAVGDALEPRHQHIGGGAGRLDLDHEARAVGASGP